MAKVLIVCAVTDTAFATAEPARLFGVTLTSAEQFLREKLALSESD